MSDINKSVNVRYDIAVGENSMRICWQDGNPDVFISLPIFTGNRVDYRDLYAAALKIKQHFEEKADG